MLNELLKEQRKLNTITKYPSILTYHSLGKKGTVTEELTPQKHKLLEDEILEATEKVDGTNVRIVFCGSDYLIGTREEFIYARGDRIINGKDGILKTCIPIAEKIIDIPKIINTPIKVSKDMIIVLYGEVYGKGIGSGYKNYTKEKIGFRVFDMWGMSLTKINDLFKLDIDKLSTWRENGGQPYVGVGYLKDFCRIFDLEKTPVLFSIKQKDFPKTIEEVYKLLLKYKNTEVALDEGTQGKSEGFVIRNDNRSYIKKIRFEEYEKTLRNK